MRQKTLRRIAGKAQAWYGRTRGPWLRRGVTASAAVACPGPHSVRHAVSLTRPAPRAPSCHPQSYDLAVARAVAEARVLAELCLPFVRVGGLWVAAKGPDPEVSACPANGFLSYCY